MNYDKSIINEFIEKSQDLLESVEVDLLKLIEQEESFNKGLINKLSHTIYMIKEEARYFGLKNINDLADTMGTLLFDMRTGDTESKANVINALLEGVDFLNIMLLRDVSRSDKMDITKIQNYLNTLITEKTSGERV